MIKEATYYEVHCDKCGERLDIDGMTAWETADDASDAIDYANWQEMESGRVYCAGCIDSGEIMFGGNGNDDDDE